MQARARAGRFSRQMGQRFDSLDALARAAAIAMEINLPRERLDARLDALRNEAIACAALPDLKRTGWVRQLPPGALCFVFDSTMTRYALRFRDGTIEVRRVADDQQIACFDAAGTRDIWVFCFSPDGRYLATTHDPGHALIVWDVDRRAIAVRDPGRVWRGVRFSPDSRRIAVAHEDGGLFLWDLANGRPSQPWPTGRSDRLAFRPDGGQIAIIDNGAEPPICRILEGVTGRLVYSFPLRGTADDVAWAPQIRSWQLQATTPRSTFGTLSLASGARLSKAIPVAACLRNSTPPAHCWQATAGTTGSGSGTRCWVGPG